MSAQPTVSSGDRTTTTEIRFHNTLSGQTEPFVPLVAGEVRSYTCGPTVYDFAHIGNFRTFVFQDVLRRYLRSKGFHVIQVMNLTDVDERIIQKSAAAGVSIREYTDKYIRAYLDDRRALNLEPPEHIARATEHIDDMVELIQRLTAKGFTYTSEGSTYYRIAKFPDYGKLSKIDVAGMQTGARVDRSRSRVERDARFRLSHAIGKQQTGFDRDSRGRNDTVTQDPRVTVVLHENEARGGARRDGFGQHRRAHIAVTARLEHDRPPHLIRMTLHPVTLLCHRLTGWPRHALGDEP